MVSFLAVCVAIGVLITTIWLLNRPKNTPANDNSSNHAAPPVERKPISTKARILAHKLSIPSTIDPTVKAFTICSKSPSFTTDDGADGVAWMDFISAASEIATVYLLCNAKDSDISQLRLSLSKMGSRCSIPPHRVLEYTTEVGKIAMVRQLKSTLHIESSDSVCAKLAPHMKGSCLIQFTDVSSANTAASATAAGTNTPNKPSPVWHVETNITSLLK